MLSNNVPGIKQIKLHIHPCYSEQAHGRFARLHLPVAADCNLDCNYCERCVGGASFHSYRPAFTREILNPKQAFNRVMDCVNQTDRLKVVGIAGPGEPLANQSTFETFELVRRNFPDLLLCISTNGILLPENIQRLKELNVNSISITINSLRMETIQKIYGAVKVNGNRIDGKEAACCIKEKQLKALESLAGSKMEFKVNTIVIPGINTGDIAEVSETIAFYGAVLHNIVPLIPLGRFSNMRRTDCEELKAARKASEKYMKQFLLCKQCPADAFDIPGGACGYSRM